MKEFLILSCFAISLSITYFIGKQDEKNKIDLPEEISQITYSDNLKGYYDGKGVLHIEFNNIKDTIK